MSTSAISQLPFTGKIIAVTGAARGIGFAIAKYLAQRGATISLSDVREADLQGAKGRLAKEAPDSIVDTQVVDVTKRDQVEGWLKGVKERFGKIDGAVNNAGICRVFPILEYPDDVLEQTINVNIKGVFHCLRAELALVEDGGSIVNMSSAAGLIGAPGFSVYCASKHAVLGLTKTASQEIAHRKIRVNAICPGAIATDMMDSINADSGENATPETSMSLFKRYGTSEEIAALAAYLLGDESKFTTGSSYTIDGGITPF